MQMQRIPPPTTSCQQVVADVLVLVVAVRLGLSFRHPQGVFPSAILKQNGWPTSRRSWAFHPDCEHRESVPICSAQVPRVIVPQPFCEGARVFRYAAVLLLLLSWPAVAEVHPDYTFSQWEKLQDDERTAYVAGLIDSLEPMAATEPAQRTARHYTECFMRSRLTAGQLADFLREYVRARPEMHGSYVQRAINDYLNALCGRPFD